MNAIGRCASGATDGRGFTETNRSHERPRDPPMFEVVMRYAPANAVVISVKPRPVAARRGASPLTQVEQYGEGLGTMKLSELLGHGYMPKQLPMGFNGRSWGSDIAKKPLPLPGSYADCPLLTHTVNRPGQLPRVLGLPHPYHFHKLASLVESNWTALSKIWSLSTISLTTPRIGDTTKGERACEPTEGWKNRPERALERRQGRKVMLKADIAQCYPSAYTHALSWAIQGRAAAVAATKTKGAVPHFADLLDKAIRDGQERQSIGIPVGPDTTFLLAETILSRVDKVLQSRIRDLQGIRIVDDYELYFDNVAQAEQAKIFLAEELARFKLQLNRSKTRVVELPAPFEPEWKRELSSFRFDGSAKWGIKQIAAAVDVCYRQRQNDPDSRSITYLLAMLSSCKFHRDAWPFVQKVAFAPLEFEENSLPRAAKLFLNATMKGWSIDKPKLGAILNRLIVKHNALRFGNAVGWSIAILTYLEISLTDEAISSSINVEDPIVLTLLAHARAEGLARSFKINSLARSFLPPSCWFGANWLFIYECVQHGWLGTKTLELVTKDLKTQPYLSSLNKRGISFYEVTPAWGKITPATVGSAIPLDAHAFSQIELLDY